MENITKQYKKHLAGFVESFEKDVQDQLYTEIKEAIEHTFFEVSLCFDVDMDHYLNEDILFQEYLEKRSRTSSSENPWYTNSNHKIMDEWKP